MVPLSLPLEVVSEANVATAMNNSPGDCQNGIRFASLP